MSEITKKDRIIARMREMEKLIPDTIKALNMVPDGYDLYTSLPPGELRIQMDYNLQDYRVLRRRLRKNWTFKYRRFNQLTGCYYIYFANKSGLDVELVVELVLVDEQPVGQNCKLVIDRYEQRPIFKVVCDE